LEDHLIGYSPPVRENVHCSCLTATGGREKKQSIRSIVLALGKEVKGNLSYGYQSLYSGSVGLNTALTNYVNSLWEESISFLDAEVDFSRGGDRRSD